MCDAIAIVTLLAEMSAPLISGFGEDDAIELNEVGNILNEMNYPTRRTPEVARDFEGRLGSIASHR